MKFAPSRVRQAPLSDREQQALRGIADGASIDLLLGERLQRLGLIAKKHNGWAITEQGHIFLMFQSAR